MLGSLPNVQNLASKIFAKYCKRLVSKVLCLVSASERSSLGLDSSFCSKSRSRLDLATSMSRLGLEDFGQDSSSARYTKARKAATSAVKKSKEKSWEEFGRRLDSNYFSANKIFW